MTQSLTLFMCIKNLNSRVTMQAGPFHTNVVRKGFTIRPSQSYQLLGLGLGAFLDS